MFPGVKLGARCGIPPCLSAPPGPSIVVLKDPSEALAANVDRVVRARGVRYGRLAMTQYEWGSPPSLCKFFASSLFNRNSIPHSCIDACFFNYLLGRQLVHTSIPTVSPTSSILISRIPYSAPFCSPPPPPPFPAHLSGGG